MLLMVVALISLYMFMSGEYWMHFRCHCWPALVYKPVISVNGPAHIYIVHYVYFVCYIFHLSVVITLCMRSLYTRCSKEALSSNPAGPSSSSRTRHTTIPLSTQDWNELKSPLLLGPAHSNTHGSPTRRVDWPIESFP